MKVRQKIIGALFAVCLMISLLPAAALAAPSNISVTKATYHSSGALTGLEASFYWSTAGAPGRLVLMTEKLNTTTSAEPTYGDFTNFGTYGSSFANFDAVQSHDTANGTFGIISSSEETETIMDTTNTKSISFAAGDIPLDKNQLYYVYLWTQYGGNYYPDTLICAIQVHDGAVKYASATGRNSYDESAFQEVTNELPSCSVNVAAAANMTKASGEESQADLNGAMTPVVYTANEGYEFPKDYAVGTVNGVMVRRDSATQITVLGTPTANADITLKAPIRKLEGLVFGYAYDVQRNVSYPANNQTVTTTKSTNSYPLDENGSHLTGYNGNWTLTKAGTYFYVSSLGDVDPDLTGIVAAFATNYIVDRDTVVVHELKKDGTHIAYGVVVAYDASNGYALFVGDNWSSGSGGAGYLLSTSEIADSSKEITAAQIATDFVPSLSIELDKSGTQIFGAETVGYAAVSPLEIIVANSGNAATGALNVSLTGDDANSFILSGVDETFKAGIANDGTDAFAVAPKADLAAGTYEATVTVSGVNVKSVSFNVSFTVNPAPVYIPVIPAPEPGCDDDAACNCFADVDEDAWYHETIDWAVENGLLRGYDDGSNNVGPDDDSTRAQIVTILWRAMGEPGATGEGAWYADAFAWALEAGVIKGYNDDPTALGPNDEITREQLAVILWRFAQLNGFDVSVGEDTNILSYEDAFDISEWAIPAMQWAIGSGIILGDDENGLIEPGDGATRAEAMAMIERFDAAYGIL